MATPVQSFEAALRTLPAVDLRERGGKSSQADISIRGGSADQTMVMLNGINFTDARTGHQSHSLPVDIESVSSVSLVRDVPGTGALSGAVNLAVRGIVQNYLRSGTAGRITKYRAISELAAQRVVCGTVRLPLWQHQRCAHAGGRQRLCGAFFPQQRRLPAQYRLPKLQCLPACGVEQCPRRLFRLPGRCAVTRIRLERILCRLQS